MSAPSSSDADRALIDLVREGDPRALDTLVRTHAKALVEFAAATVGDVDLAHDVVQEVFVAVWDGRERLLIRGSVAGYLYRAVRNRALNTLRHERTHDRMRAELSDATTAVAANGGDALAETELLDALRRALAELPERSRLMFHMYVWDGLTYETIAEALSVDVRTVQNQVSRATRHVLMRFASP